MPGGQKGKAIMLRGWGESPLLQGFSAVALHDCLAKELLLDGCLGHKGHPQDIQGEQRLLYHAAPTSCPV